MARFEVQIPTRRLDAILDSAEEAYQWLDDNARPGERYQINAIAPQGGVVAIDVDFYVANDQGPPAA
jgi:hypothetical protein